MNSNNQNIPGNDISRLVSRLKTEDSNYATLSRILQIIYWIFVPVYMLIALRHYTDSGDVSQLVGGACMVLAFLIFALFFGKYSKEYKYVDYSLPTLIMLKKAVYRYKPFHVKALWVIAALVLMDIGLFYSNQNDGTGTGMHFIFIGAVLVGLIAGLIIWYIKYKPLRDDALRLIAEIEGD